MVRFVLLLTFVVIVATVEAYKFNNLSTFTSSNQDLVSAINVICAKIKFTTFNIICTSNNSETRDLMEKVAQANTARLVRLATGGKVLTIKQRFNLILLDGIVSFREFNPTLNPEFLNFSGFYLFVLMNGNSEEHNEIFATLWRKQIYNADLMFIDGSTVAIETFLPFKKGAKCGETSPIRIKKFGRESFQANINELFPEKFMNLQRCAIKVVTFEDNLAVFKSENINGSFQLQGFDMELLSAMSKALNFETNVTFLETSEPWGKVFENGTATGALAILANHSTDIAIGDYFLKPSRLLVADSSIPYYSFPLVFVVPPGEPTGAFQKLVQPFEQTVWIFLLLTLFISLMSIFLIKFQFPHLAAFVFGNGIKSPVSNLFKIIFGYSQSKLPSRNFARFLQMMFMLFCLVQRSIYQGSLYIFLQSDGLEKEVQTFEEMIERDFYYYMFEVTADIFENQSVYERIKFIDSNQYDELLSKPLLPSQKAAYLMSYVDVAASNQKHCNTFIHKISDVSMRVDNLVLYYPKNFYLRETINKKLNQFISAGLIEFWVRKFLNARHIYEPEHRGAKQMSLNHFLGVFKVYSIGCFASLVIFLFELIEICRRSRKTNHKRQMA